MYHLRHLITITQFQKSHYPSTSSCTKVAYQNYSSLESEKIPSSYNNNLFFLHFTHPHEPASLFDELELWLDTWIMKFNLTKCKVMKWDTVKGY